MAPKRPLKMRLKSVLIDRTAGLYNLVSKISYADFNHPIGWKDRLRWSPERLIDPVFNWAFNGSDEEIQAVYNREVPLNAMSSRQRALLDSPIFEYPVRCVQCQWTGCIDECVEDKCPVCQGSVYVD